MPSTRQSKVIDAPLSAVWARFRDFHDLSWAPNVITAVEKVGDVGGGQVGARRILNDAFHETLVAMDEDQFTLRYSIDDGPSPVSKAEVSDYYGVIRLTPTGDGNSTLVEWTSSWESKTDDAVAFCHGIYVALLNALSESFKK